MVKDETVSNLFPCTPFICASCSLGSMQPLFFSGCNIRHGSSICSGAGIRPSTVIAQNPEAWVCLFCRELPQWWGCIWLPFKPTPSGYPQKKRHTDMILFSVYPGQGRFRFVCQACRACAHITVKRVCVCALSSPFLPPGGGVGYVAVFLNLVEGQWETTHEHLQTAPPPPKQPIAGKLIGLEGMVVQAQVRS